MKDNGAERVTAKPATVLRKNQVRVPKAAELVSRELRKQIVRGELKEGATLFSETELMQHFGVSRPTLREALRILESEGLISVSRGARGGAVICGPTVEVATRYISLLLQVNGTTLADIHRVHMLLGPAAARLLAEKYRSTAPAVLRACLAEGYDKLDDDFEYGIVAAQFRSKLIELTNLPPLAMVTNILSSIFETGWASATVAAGRLVDNSQDKRRGLRSMKKLIDLIESGDADAAEKHWLRHTEYVQKTMSNWLPATAVIDILDDHKN